MAYNRKEYQKKYQREYYKENKEKVKLKLRKLYYKNREKRLHYQDVYLSEKKMSEKYNRPIKNIIRSKIIEELERRDIKTILTLESEDFLFNKLLPEKKIYVFEKDKNVFNRMLKTQPKNTILNFGDISKFADYDLEVDLIYLDFCCAYPTAKEVIYNLKNKIQNCKLFALTLCTWDETKEANGDYQFDLINKLQGLIGINFKVIFGQGYRDKKHSTMVTIILENPTI